MGARNELGQLGDAINLMAQSLEASQSRNAAQQARLRDLHRLGSQTAATLELPRMLAVAARGLRAICGGDVVVAGAAGRRDRAIRVWAVEGRAVSAEEWEVALEPVEKVLGAETRLLTRAELAAAGFTCLASIPGGYALTAPEGLSSGSVAMKRVGGPEYKIEYFPTALSNVARQTKHMPTEWIVNGNDLSKAYIDYVRPLVGPLPKPGKLF